MKWKNKGHEFDQTYVNINNLRGFYLFGAGNDGNMVYKILTEKLNSPIKLLGYIDNDKNKRGKKLNGLDIYSFDDITIQKDQGVIISIASEVLKPMTNQLESFGLKKNINYFHYYEFISVIAAYKENKVFVPSISFIMTARCNLKCKACLNFSPYIKTYEDRSFPEIKKDIDLFFSVVDFINVFHISGGEPMLHKDLPKLIRYIYENYKDRIYSLETVTNGTIMPGDDFLKTYKECEFRITLDDYTKAIPDNEDKLKKIADTLKNIDGKGSFVVRNYDSWIDLAPFRKIEKTFSEHDLIEKYNSCHVPWSEYKDGKLSMCTYSAFANTAGIIPETYEEEYFDFTDFDEERKKELVEFRLGYSKKGYTEFCKRCAGYIEINPYIVEPAIQIPRGENKCLI